MKDPGYTGREPASGGPVMFCFLVLEKWYWFPRFVQFVKLIEMDIYMHCSAHTVICNTVLCIR